MKLLFDQNLSHRLCRLLADIFPETQQVKPAGLERATDDGIWQYARKEGFTIVTLDADLAALRGAPPKVIRLRCGNQSTAVIERILRNHAGLIASFAVNEDATCLELY